jgi:hypothetical protein
VTGFTLTGKNISCFFFLTTKRKKKKQTNKNEMDTKKSKEYFSLRLVPGR